MMQVPVILLLCCKQENISCESHYRGSMQPDRMSDFPKAGFARLLKFFESSTDDVVKLTRAFGLATKIHKGQLLGKTEPYINHLLRTALILVEELQTRDLDLACAALLHAASDSIQDEELKEYSERVYSTVRAAAGLPNAEQQFAAMSKAPKDVRYVRLAEQLDIARSIKNQALRDKMLRFKDETQKYVMPIATATDDKLAFKLSVALYELK
jgi:(p)ppGpp synthase/HD superfamily hydrolase